MKKLLILMAFFAGFESNTFAQSNKNVPEAVKIAFSQKFPDANVLKWIKENAQEWEIEFNVGEKIYTANYDSKGTWLETEFTIYGDNLPEAVIAAFDKKFGAKTKFKKVLQIEKKDGTVCYEI